VLISRLHHPLVFSGEEGGHKFLHTQIIIIISAATAMISAAFSIRQTLVLSILKLTVAFSSNTLYSLVEYTPNVPLSPVVCQP
jgi:hypothetical protein